MRDPEALRLLADDAELVPRSRTALIDGFAAAAERHADPETASNAVRALRRRELFRVACADLLGFVDVEQVGEALAHVTDATLAATLGGDPAAQSASRTCRSRSSAWAASAAPRPATRRTPTCCSSSSRCPAWPTTSRAAARWPSPRRSGGCWPGRPPTRRSGSTPTCGPRVARARWCAASAAYQQYYARWSKVWEAQALLRARFVAGDEALGRAVPGDGRPDALSERRPEPRAGRRDPAHQGPRRQRAAAARRRPGNAHQARAGAGSPTSSGPCSCFSCCTATASRSCAPRARWTRSRAATKAGLLDPADAFALDAGWRRASWVRNALDPGPRPRLGPAAPPGRRPGRGGPDRDRGGSTARPSTRRRSSTSTCGSPAERGWPSKKCSRAPSELGLSRTVPYFPSPSARYSTPHSRHSDGCLTSHSEGRLPNRRSDRKESGWAQFPNS